MSQLFALTQTHDVTSDDWYTPRWIFDALGIEFDLDVCAPESGAFVPARDRYTIVDDGLSRVWHGRVWCNPPYSDPLPWCRRWARHDDGLLLIRSDVNSAAAQTALAAADAMWANRRRIRFVQNGKEGTAPSFSTVMFARGSGSVEAMSRLAPLGVFKLFEASR